MYKLLLIFISFFFSFNAFAYPTGLLNYKLDDIFVPDNSFIGFKDGFFKKTEKYNLFIYTDENHRINNITMFPRILFSNKEECTNYIENMYNNSKQYYIYKNKSSNFDFYLSSDKSYNEYETKDDFFFKFSDSKDNSNILNDINNSLLLDLLSFHVVNYSINKYHKSSYILLSCDNDSNKFYPIIKTENMWLSFSILNDINKQYKIGSFRILNFQLGRGYNFYNDEHYKDGSYQITKDNIKYIFLTEESKYGENIVVSVTGASQNDYSLEKCLKYLYTVLFDNNLQSKQILNITQSDYRERYILSSNNEEGLDIFLSCSPGYDLSTNYSLNLSVLTNKNYQ